MLSLFQFSIGDAEEGHTRGLIDNNTSRFNSLLEMPVKKSWQIQNEYGVSGFNSLLEMHQVGYQGAVSKYREGFNSLLEMLTFRVEADSREALEGFNSLLEMRLKSGALGATAQVSQFQFSIGDAWL